MCASVAAHYELNQVFDKLIISLCKFTTLLNPPEVYIHVHMQTVDKPICCLLTYYPTMLFIQTPTSVVMTLGTSSKVRLCLLTVFSLAHQHGNILRDSWKNILDALVALFKAKLLPDELVQVCTCV